MKKILVSALLASSIVASGAISIKPTIAQAATQTNNSVVSEGQGQTSDNLLTYQNGDNILSNISQDKATNFDTPQATDSGVLLRMNSTTINTKYGQMQVQQEQNGYKVTNLTNPKAPILQVGVVNNIYGVGSAVDLKGLVDPVLYNSNNQEIKGTIIFPNISTATPTYQESYIEATDGNGNVTIAPFIYNVVNFKDSINVPENFNVQNLTVNDILSGGEGNLRSYVAQYTKGSDKIIVGVSRGVASIRKEIPITFGDQKPVQNEQTNTTPPKEQVQPQANNKQQVHPNIPLYAKIIVNPITYFIIGAILIALIWFLCF